VTPRSLVDRSLKSLLRKVPEVPFRLMGTEVNSSAIEPAPISVVVKELQADDVFVHREDDSAWALYVEYQFEPDRRHLRKWLQKALALDEHLDLRVILAVLYLRKGDRATFPDTYRAVGGELANEHRFVAIRLWEHADRIRSGELVGLVPLLVLCEDRPAEETVREERELLRSAELSEETRADLLGAAYLLGLRYLTPRILDAVFRKELPVLKEAGIIGEWIEEARQEARQEERLESEARGRAIEARHMVTLALGKRFGELPPGLVAQIEVADREWCEELLARAMQVESVSELLP
jgi:predicted transposase YdaD